MWQKTSPWLDMFWCRLTRVTPPWRSGDAEHICLKLWLQVSRLEPGVVSCFLIIVLPPLGPGWGLMLGWVLHFKLSPEMMSPGGDRFVNLLSGVSVNNWRHELLWGEGGGFAGRHLWHAWQNVVFVMARAPTHHYCIYTGCWCPVLRPTSSGISWVEAKRRGFDTCNLCWQERYGRSELKKLHIGLHIWGGVNGGIYRDKDKLESIKTFCPNLSLRHTRH